MNGISAEYIKHEEFDFVDFGCKKGGSFSFCERVLGGKRGLGIDKNPVYVTEFCEAGGEAIVADVTQTGLPNDFVRFVCVSHLLEHLPNWDIVEKALLEAIRIAREYVYVVGPYFDADDYLESMGITFFWSNWSWHPTHVDARSLAGILRKHGHTDFECWGKIKILGSDNVAIHPIDSPRDQHDYDENIHPPKPSIQFDRPIYREMVFLIPLKELPDKPSILSALKLVEPLDV